MPTGEIQKRKKMNEVILRKTNVLTFFDRIQRLYHCSFFS